MAGNPGLKNVWQKVEVTNTTSTDSEGAGRIRIDEDGQVYRWVKNGHTAATAVGDLCIYKVADGAAMYKTVIQPTTAGLGNLAGVWQGVVKAGEYGWIMIRGVCNANCQPQASADTAIGAIFCGANGQSYAAYSVALGTAPKYTANLVLLEALAQSAQQTVTAKLVEVKCL